MLKKGARILQRFLDSYVGAVRISGNYETFLNPFLTELEQIQHSAILVFPELCIEFFNNSTFLQALKKLIDESKNIEVLTNPPDRFSSEEESAAIQNLREIGVQIVFVPFYIKGSYAILDSNNVILHLMGKNSSLEQIHTNGNPTIAKMKRDEYMQIRSHQVKEA